MGASHGGGRIQEAIVLLSGGMDSCTVLAQAVLRYRVIPLTFQYGSKHEGAESACATAIAMYYDGPGSAEPISVRIPDIFKNTGLVDQDLPSGRTLEEMEASGIAPSYVPMRNTVLLGIAGAIADGRGISTVLYGAHKEDHVGYPDCRPEWVAAMSAAMMIGSKNQVHIEAPFIWESKAEIVRQAARHGAPLHMTHSCYLGKRPACGTCDTCIIRIDAFKTAGFMDPIPYAIDINWDSGLGAFPVSEELGPRRSQA